MRFISENFQNLNPVYQMVISFIDILIVAFIFYGVLTVVKNNTKTLRIFKGTIIIILVDFIARTMHLTTLHTITQNLINWGFLVFIIIFQPEIRGFLEKIGRSSLGNYFLSDLNITDKTINEVSDAVLSLSENKIGALITFERNTPLQDFIDSGVRIDSDVSKELLLTIFKVNTALHDGAVIIKGNRIACASTYFPPPSIDVLQSFGSRHRAATGISEISDSLTIVVSEETGTIRLFEYGKPKIVSKEEFKKTFVDCLTATTDYNEVESGVDSDAK